MHKTFVLAALIVAGLMPSARADDVLVRKLPVKPETCYRLSFRAETATPGATWLLRVSNRDGTLPYDGCYERDWQRITPGKASYTHSFLTLSEAADLSFGVRSEGELPQVSDVTLEEVKPASLLVNGDFAAGKDDYSGWTEHYNTTFVEKDGKVALKVEHNGYVLTDPVSIAGDGQYRYAPGSYTATSILAYDSNLHLTEIVPFDRKAGVITMPSEAAYVRLLYQTWWDHLPQRTITISGAGLVKNGDTPRDVKADAPRFSGEIILDARSDAREENAARELQYWIGQITDKRAPVLAVASKMPNMKIYVGSKWAAKYTDDLAYLGDSDGYAVRRDGRNLYVFGANPRGTLFGVFALLERNTDIIWPRPNPKSCAVFSKTDDLKFATSDFRSRPAFTFRQISIGGLDRDPVQSHIWRGRNGVNEPMMLGKGFQYLQWRAGALIGAGGGYMRFLGLERDDKFYPLVNGVRMRSVWPQPCYTNPDVVNVIVSESRKMLESIPGKMVEFFIIRIGDNWNVCACPDCMTPIRLADGTVLEPKATNSSRDPVFFSTRNFTMMNKIAEKLVKDYPDLKIHTHAYIFTAEPPKVKLHPAIVPHFAAYPTANARYPVLSQPPDLEEAYGWGRRFRQWGAEQDANVRFGCFGYYYTQGFNALADTAAADYRALADMRGIQVHTEGLPGDTDDPSTWDVDGPEKWVIAKLMWDPSQDPAALREEYIKRVYHDAAPIMSEFYRLIRESWHDKTNTTSVNCHSSARSLFQEFLVKPGIEKRAGGLLEKARKAATNPTSQNMIARTLAQFDAYAADLGRLFIPLVPEAAQEWGDHSSPHWHKALSVSDFTRVANWEPLPTDARAKHKTQVAIMRDNQNLYVKVDASVEGTFQARPASRVEAFPKGDRVEIVLRSGADAYYIAVGSDGGTYCLKNWDSGSPWQNSTNVRYLPIENGWSALIAVRMSDLGVRGEEVDMDGKFCRVFDPAGPDREESTFNGSAIFNNATSLRNPLKFEK